MKFSRPLIYKLKIKLIKKGQLIKNEQTQGKVGK